jgi:cytochrome c-type biogenesis protein CcmH
MAMSEHVRSIIAIALSAAALVVIVVGLAASDQPPVNAEERVAALSASIKCPFCNGESLAESGSGVAADYRQLIAERVAAGYTDDEIRQEFADNFGDSFILDTSTSSWALALWIIPMVAMAAGVAVVVSMRRAAKQSEEVTT